MLNEFVFTKIENEDIGNIWFPQDGATCHTGRIVFPIRNKRNLGKYSVVFFKHFPKKRYLSDPVFRIYLTRDFQAAY